MSRIKNAGFSYFVHVHGHLDLQTREAIWEKRRATLDSNCLKPAKRKGETAPSPAKRLRCFLNQCLSASNS